jgi:hypothetical protein
VPGAVKVIIYLGVRESMKSKPSKVKTIAPPRKRPHAALAVNGESDDGNNADDDSEYEAVTARKLASAE